MAATAASATTPRRSVLRPAFAVTTPDPQPAAVAFVRIAAIRWPTIDQSARNSQWLPDGDDRGRGESARTIEASRGSEAGSRTRLGARRPRLASRRAALALGGRRRIARHPRRRRAGDRGLLPPDGRRRRRADAAATLPGRRRLLRRDGGRRPWARRRRAQELHRRRGRARVRRLPVRPLGRLADRDDRGRPSRSGADGRRVRGGREAPRATGRVEPRADRRGLAGRVAARRDADGRADDRAGRRVEPDARAGRRRSPGRTARRSPRLPPTPGRATSSSRRPRRRTRCSAETGSPRARSCARSARTTHVPASSTTR